MRSLVPVVLIAALLPAGCTDQPQPLPPPTTASTATPSPTPVACSLGEVRFGPIKNSYLVTEASPVMVVTAPGGGRLDKPKELVRRPRVQVRAGAEVPHEYIYEQLAAKFEVPLVDYGAEYQPAEAGGVNEIGGPGRFVEYEALRTIEATFEYRCGGVTSRGSVSTWRNGGHGGVLDCDEVPDDADADSARQAMFREAAKLRC